MIISKTSKRYAAAQRLLDAGMDFWEACHQEKQYGAVQWVDSNEGHLIIFTRGEYREQLMHNIHTLPGQPEVNFFIQESKEDD